MPVDLWTSEPFLTDVTAWVGEQAAAAGLHLDGSREQPHARPWSSAVVFGTDHGRIWFKVNGPGTRFETSLVGLVSHVVPDLVPEVVAVDPERCWTLLRDAGPTMRSVAPPDELWDRWCALLPRYAESQLRLADHRSELVEAGVGDLGPQTLPDRLRALVDELRALPPERGGLTTDEAEDLRRLFPEYDAWCAELAASGVPVTLNHDDLHSNNVCVGPAGAKVIDWGDACVSHPFGTMLATLNSIAFHAEVERDDPRVERVRDAYLEPFGAYGSRADLQHWVSLARRTGCVTRALSYRNALEGEDESAFAELEWPVRGWLLEVLDPEVG